MREDISNGGYLRGRSVALVAVVALVASLAIAMLASSLAAASSAPGHASTSLYRLSLKITSRGFLGDGTENPIAVDRHGNIYAFKATRTQQGSLPSGDAADVEEISPTGKRIRSFSTTFRLGGQRRYLQVNGLAVTPGGHDVLVAGNVSKSLSGLVDSRPYLAEYSASTGAFLRGKGFDGDDTRLGTGVAVDPTGQHVYVGDERNQFVGRTTARIYEFDVANLHEVRHFSLAGNDVCCELAVTPDGHLFAQVGPPQSTQVLLQEYSSTGGYENQFSSPPGGLAVGPTGDLFVGSRVEHRIDRLSRTGKLLETLGAGHFTGLPVAAAVNAAGDVFAFDAATNDVSAMLKFAPVVPQTTITSHPPATLLTPSATFRFKSSLPGAKLECRLRKAGASPPAYEPCSSPKTYPAQPSGSYIFEARSISPAGPVEPTPAKFTFKVVYPETTITSTPATTIGTITATFAFKSSSAGATFACRLALVGSPAPSFKKCPSPVTYVQLSDGVWKFEVQSTSTHGLTDPTPATYQFRIDTTPPTVTAPAAPTIPVGDQLQLDGTLGVQETWSASDTFSPSSALLYTVEQRAGATPASLGSFADIPTLENMRGTTSALVPIAPGGPEHQLRVRAENQLGVAAEGPAGDPFTLNVIDDSAASVMYPTGWAPATDPAAYGGTLHTSSASVAASMPFLGGSIAVIAPVGPAYGSIRVCIDGTVGLGSCTTVSENSATAVAREVVYVSAPIAAGMHSVAISSANGLVALDAFAVLG